MYDSSYRPHIDGLRAIAVTSVILFHLEFEAFSGGFVGVDVFFVISGFLITRLIYNEVLETGSFRFTNFFVRRARRLFPSLFFTLLICFLFAVVLFSPQHLQRFGGSFVYTIISIANLYFWKESNYFDTARSFKPLLHTWSLSVEEQFYLVWPFFLVFLLIKLPRFSAPILLALLGLLSLFLNYAFAEWFSNGSASIFYLAPFRVFEFSIGAVMVWLIRFQPNKNLVQEFFLLLGLAMIAYSVTVFTKNTLFPSFNALIPCIGTAAVIYGGSAKFSGKLLDNRFAIGIGLISYSLYLIHWPIIVFYKYYKFDKITLAEQGVILVVSLLAAVLMLRFIEQPFRIAKDYTISWVPSKLGIASAILVLFAVMLAVDIRRDGWEFRIDEKHRSQLAKNKNEQFGMEIHKLNSYVWNRKNKHLASNQNGKRVLIIGDSHAGNIANSLAAANFSINHYVEWMVINADCDIVISEKEITVPEHKKALCKRKHKALLELSNLEKYDLVILASSWQGQGVALLKDTISALEGKGAHNIVVIGSKYVNASGQDVLGRVRLFNLNKPLIVRPSEYSNKVNEKLDSMNLGSKLINPLEFFCNEENICRSFDDDGYILTYDAGHLTPKGALFFGNALVNSQPLKDLVAHD